MEKTTGLVYDILTQYEDTRNSDEQLYLKVLEHYGQKLGVNFDLVSVSSFFRVYRKYKIPSIETVGRCRRKLQEEYDELGATDTVRKMRADREVMFRNYARGI